MLTKIDENNIYSKSATEKIELEEGNSAVYEAIDFLY